MSNVLLSAVPSLFDEARPEWAIWMNFLGLCPHPLFAGSWNYLLALLGAFFDRIMIIVFWSTSMTSRQLLLQTPRF